MLRSILTAALRNMACNRLYAAISIGGLAIGMAAAILTGLYIRDELTFDHFILGYDHVYVVVAKIQISGRAPIVEPESPWPTASWLKEDFAGVEAAAGRLSVPMDVRRGDADALEGVSWVDPDFFKLLPLKAVAGDPEAAIRQPDGVVITRAMARKYFGRDTPLGETLQVKRSLTMTVRAVIEDLPHNSHLADQIYASAMASGSPQTLLGSVPYSRGNFQVSGMTYVRFRSPSDAARAIGDMGGVVARHMLLNGKWLGQFSGSLELTPLRELHLAPLSGSAIVATISPGDPKALTALAAIAGLVLLMAAINFINLSTARAGRRAVEVGVRKTAGAHRSHLVAQFVGETLIQVLLALVFAAAIVELTLPALNAFLLRDMSFAFWKDSGLVGALLVLMALMALLAGLYPALVLSSFRPAAVVRGGGQGTSGLQALRTALVTFQFAALIGLLVSTAVIVRQTRYALEDRLKLATHSILVLELPSKQKDLFSAPEPLCRGALVDEIRRLPGVAAAACSSANALDEGDSDSAFALQTGTRVSLNVGPAGAGFFELYGVHPIAGRTLVPGPRDEGRYAGMPPAFYWIAPSVVLNQTAARLAGFADPAKAIGAPIRFLNGDNSRFVDPPATIVGVVPDFAFDLIHGPTLARAYFDIPEELNRLSVKLNGQNVRETIGEIDALWKRFGEPRAVSHQLLSDQLGALYIGVIRQEMLVSALAGVAVVVAGLGLYGMAAFTAERRTKEIGVRKAMGASTLEVMGLLLWSFAQPVLWANLIAWPVGWWAMHWWLQGFSARIDLSPLYFLAAGGAALVIAAVTVCGHALHVARAEPARALRYE